MFRQRLLALVLLTVTIALFPAVWIAWGCFHSYWQLINEDIGRHLFLKHGDSIMIYPLTERLWAWITMGWPLILLAMVLAAVTALWAATIARQLRRLFFH